MSDMHVDQMPYAISYSEPFDYSVKAEAWRIMGFHGIGVGVDKILANPKLLPEVLRCLAFMAAGGVRDYYRGDQESASLTITREFMLCDQLAHAEAELLQTHEGTSEELKTEMKAQEQEIRAAMDAGTPPPQPRRLKLPAGSRPDATTYRALAIWRQREAAEE